MHVHHKLVQNPKNYQDPTMPNLTDSAHANQDRIVPTNGAKPQRGPKLCHHRIVDGLDEPGLLVGSPWPEKK
jgi:hypothetical protein